MSNPLTGTFEVLGVTQLQAPTATSQATWQITLTPSGTANDLVPKTPPLQLLTSLDDVAQQFTVGMNYTMTFAPVV